MSNDPYIAIAQTIVQGDWDEAEFWDEAYERLTNNIADALRYEASNRDEILSALKRLLVSQRGLDHLEWTAAVAEAQAVVAKLESEAA